jgi:hypothetical protein
VGPRELASLGAELLARPAPPLGAGWEGRDVVRALFVPEVAKTAIAPRGVVVVTAAGVFAPAARA